MSGGNRRATVRTYGGWTVPRSEGLFGMTTPMTVAFFIWIVVLIIGFQFLGIVVALIWVLLGVGAGVALMLRPQGRSIVEWVYLTMAFYKARKKGRTSYRSGPFSQVAGGRYRLPGALAKTQMHEGVTVGGRPFGMIHNPVTDEYTIVFRVWPQGDELVDATTADVWVDMWGSYLASLGSEGDVVGVTAVVETFPATGVTVRSEVTAMVSEQAPQLAQQIMVEAAQMQSTQTLAMDARLAITFKATTAVRRKEPKEQATELGRRIPLLLQRLSIAGLRAREMTHAEIVTVVKRAYDPGSQEDMERAATTAAGHGLTWADAGPAACEQTTAHYFHDGAVSSTWEMVEPPRGYVTSDILKGLLEKKADVPRKRIALCYRPHTAGEAASIVDKDAVDARQATKQERQRKGVASARKEQRELAAETARQAEALGHGLTRFGVLMTLTEPARDLDRDGVAVGEDRMPNAEAVLKSLTQQARLLVRRRYASQQISFAAGLGVGVLIPEHLSAAAMVQG